MRQTGVLLSLLVVAALGAAVPARAADDLYLVPRDTAAQATRAAGVDVVASYPGFVLAGAPQSAADAMRAAGAVRRDDMRRVALQGRTVDPAREPRPADGPARLLVVQFVGPVKDAWLDALRATGARVVSYMAQNAYLVYARPARLANPGAEVRGVFALQAGDKVAPEVAHGEGVRAQVQTLSGAAGEGVRARLRATATRLRPALRIGPYVTQFVQAPRAALDRLAADAGVVAIEGDGELRAEDESQAQVLAANVNALVTGPSGPGYLAWFRATFPTAPNPFDFVVDLSDSGLDDGATSGPTVHPDLAGRVAYNDSFMANDDATGRDCTGHGSLNAGIVAGFNDSQGSAVHEDANGYQYGLGIAPYVKVGSSKMLDSCGDSAMGSLADVAANAYAKGARIVNNSWGSTGPGNTGAPYTTVSQAYDSFVRDAQPAAPGNQELVEIKSAGNAGTSGSQTISPPGTAKNLITVGATENVRAFGTPNDGAGITDALADNILQRIGFSSKGPTADGRLKPDLMAPGTHVAGTLSQAAGFANSGISGTSPNPARAPFNTLYSASSGTSHSAPAVAGAAALVRQFFSTLPANAFTPSPAFTKAVLVNAARDHVIDGSAPNTSQGYGFVNLEETLGEAGRYFFDQRQRFDNSSETFARALVVPSSTVPVRVTLAWTDPPGPTVGNAFVNDLDLEVEIAGQTYRGNTFNLGTTPAGGSPDTKNNVEKVMLAPGVSGPITVRVRATNVAGDGVPGVGDATDQDFALATLNAGAPPIAVEPAILPGGQAGTPYSQTLTASGGSAGGPFSFAVGTGTPPAGLALSAQGVLSGTPTAAATSSFAVQVTDAGGQAETKSYSVTIAAPPPPPRPAAAAIAAGAPRVSALRISPATFTRARGTTISFTLSHPGRVVLTFESKLGGRRVGSRCVAPTRANRGRRDCIRYRARGRLERTGKAGANSIRFAGRVGRRTLAVDRYRLTAFGRLANATTAPLRRSFRIIRR